VALPRDTLRRLCTCNAQAAAGQGANSQGIAAPVFTGHWRNDKAPEDATIVEEVVSISRAARRPPTSA